MNRNLFNSIQLTKPKKNVFDLSHDVKLSLNPGELIPILCLDCVPGDSFNLACQSLLRFSPLVFPMMHRVNVSMHYFFVPNRLVWESWERWITGDSLQGPVGPLTPPTFPYINIGGPAATPPLNNYTRLADYLGVPNPDLDPTTPTNVNTERISAIPFAAYQKIYADYYRDENLIEDDTAWVLQDGDNSTLFDNLGVLHVRAWEHDYFTGSLPWAQKGASVGLPLGSGIVELDMAGSQIGVMRTAVGRAVSASGDVLTSVSGNGNITVDTTNSVYDPNGSLSVDVGSTNINDLRRAFRLQEWLEKNARAGTRYTENILAHFGVRSSDKRLQRSEYIIGTKSPVVISEVLNTTGTDDLPQGNMAGHGVSVTSGQYGRYFCEEHGYIIGIMSVIPRTAYQQGIPRHFLKGTGISQYPNTPLTDADRFEFFWPAFANIGEQPVFNREIFAFDATSGETFGYVPRYAEYKYMPSRVAGDFRFTPFNEWHWGRIFATPPALNQEFVECVPDHRIFAVDGDDPAIQKLYAHVFNKIKAVRPMPKFGTPSF